MRNTALPIMGTPTSIDCGREVKFRRSFRSLIECMVPCCGLRPSSNSLPTDSDSDSSLTTLTGTFFGYKKGRVNFCLQDHGTRNLTPLLLLELPVPTSYLAKEMQHGVLRIALDCENDMPISLYDVPVWSMYCNGRKVGFATRRQVNVNDVAVLKMMQSVSVGVGVVSIPGSNPGSSFEGDYGEAVMYLRASFERVVGSVDNESLHMINPVGSSGQELSIFMVRS